MRKSYTCERDSTWTTNLDLKIDDQQMHGGRAAILNTWSQVCCTDIINSNFWIQSQCDLITKWNTVEETKISRELIAPPSSLGFLVDRYNLEVMLVSYQYGQRIYVEDLLSA